MQILRRFVAILLVSLFLIVLRHSPWSTTPQVPEGRSEVVFWHFWGGEDRETVDDVVRRFNASQPKYFVRSIAMPGANLDLKLFMAVTGGNPPDVVNQDDPILADWASRGAILPLSSVAAPSELQAAREWLFPAAVRLVEFEGELFALCNGLDVRALFYNATLLQRHGLTPPTTIDELDVIAEAVAPPASAENLTTYGFLPNPRNLWAWGVVFGGSFVDATSGQVTLDHPGIVQALEWMSRYGERYGSSALSFRARDQSLPGKTFPLLANRYAMMVDGQWRIRDIERFIQARSNPSSGTRRAHEHPAEFGVCPLPQVTGGPQDAGWINGNFFVVPAGAKNIPGAWEFMKFWSGFGGHAASAAETCVRGGWIPVAQEVVDEPIFQDHVRQQPLWEEFLRLAASPTQQPRPNIRAAQYLDRLVRDVAERAMYGSSAQTVSEMLVDANRRFQEAQR